MRKALCAVLLTGLLLLVLSALVVTPEGAADRPAVPISPAAVRAAFLPMPVCETDTAAAPLRQTRIPEAFFCLMAAFALPCLFTRDSNGRVLCAARYENSVYQVFRPEVAGG